MKIYMVGGAVRDKLMGLEPKDIDYVVVGATPQMMLDKGFSQVGASFPVFLHPETGDEYALARTERKTGVGYNGFDVSFDSTITLEEDLIRRDLTINAMAMDLETGELIDPYGGQHDLAQGIIRHTSEAFAEDPVRVLRAARFSARYGFKIASDTVSLMQNVVGELDYVPAERIFAEFQKGLMEKHPYEMYRALYASLADTTQSVAPYMRSDMWGMLRLTDIEKQPLYVRFALVARQFTAEDFDKCKIPTDLAKVAKAFAAKMYQWFNMAECSDEVFISMCEQVRAFSGRELFDQCVDVATFVRPSIDRKKIHDRLAKATNIDAGTIAASVPVKDGKLISQTIRNARLAALSQ